MRRRAGFTLLELLIAMSVFAMLATAAVVLMRQAIGIFSAGARDNELSDRQDALIPELRADFMRLATGDNLDPPVLPPEASSLGGAKPPPPPPPVAVRLRAGTLLLRDPADTSLKSHPCTYFAFVISTGDEGHDPLLRTAGDAPTVGETPKAFAKPEVDKGIQGTVFRPTGGLMEVCWIAVPLNRDFPSILSVFRGYRAPVGGPESLLDPANFDSIAKIRAKFDLRHEGVIHFAVTWRRATAVTWDETVGRGIGDDVAYVGPAWDSTRGLDRTWPLHRGPASVPDPSDDLFPQYVRIEATIGPVGPLGYGRGETRLQAAVGSDEVRIAVASLEALLGPGGTERYLKIDGEWLRYDPRRVDVGMREVPVERGVRGTTRQGHQQDAEVYVGEPASEVIKLPVFLDRTIKKKSR